MKSPASRLLLNRLFRRRSKKTSKLRVTGLCEGNSPVPSEFPAHRASSAENVSIWWRHHVCHHMVSIGHIVLVNCESRKPLFAYNVHLNRVKRVMRIFIACPVIMSISKQCHLISIILRVTDSTVFVLVTKKITKIRITGPLCRESILGFSIGQ